MRFAALVVQAAFLFQYQDCTNYLSSAFSSSYVANRPSSSGNGQNNDIISAIQTNDNAFVNNNAAVRGTGRLCMSKNDNFDEDNVQDLHDISISNKKKGISPAGIFGASTVITTQLYATKVCYVAMDSLQLHVSNKCTSCAQKLLISHIFLLYRHWR